MDQLSFDTIIFFLLLEMKLSEIFNKDKLMIIKNELQLVCPVYQNLFIFSIMCK